MRGDDLYAPKLRARSTTLPSTAAPDAVRSLSRVRSFAPLAPLALAAALTALSLGLAPREVRAIEWPTRAPVEDDPVRELRWTYVPRWVAPNHPRLAAIQRALDASPSATALWFARRALVLRLSDQEEPCRAALATALRMQPDLSLADPDVGLTQAWLQARTHDWTGAFESATVPLSRMSASIDRERLVLDLTRWSMARGPDGLAPALSLLRQYAMATAGRGASPVVTVTMALVLSRMGRAEEARALARSVADVLRPDLGSDHYPLGDGALVLGEGDAAVGNALLLVGRGRDAVEALERASTSVPMPWRASTLAALALARRSPPAPAAPQSPATALPDLVRIRTWPE